MNDTRQEYLGVAEPYHVKEDGVISVCAACFPGESIYQLFPDLRISGAMLSHGYCERHFRRFQQEILRRKTN